MGYKLAGCEVLGCVEIDKRMNDIYIANHHPKYNFLMDIREFNKIPNDQLPQELFNLDILDGSPPCSSFSMAGSREKDWGKEKKFREGQKLQTLDDLFFVFLDTVEKLKPKVVIAENVKGLLAGSAYEYVRQIHTRFNKAGYTARHYLVKGEEMGVPQTRHRVFFVAIRNDLQVDIDTIKMDFNYEPVLFKEIKAGVGKTATENTTNILNHAEPKDKCLADVLVRLENRYSRFNEVIVWDDNICPTIHNHGTYRGNDKTRFSKEDFVNASTFPQDYDFIQDSKVGYVVGMSVPPIMAKRVAERVIEKAFNKGSRKLPTCR
jgi:DNA (cytosine-5)-methyltransferase 1